jgi:hypothetical protein
VDEPGRIVDEKIFGFAVQARYNKGFVSGTRKKIPKIDAYQRWVAMKPTDEDLVDLGLVQTDEDPLFSSFSRTFFDVKKH